jgi:hypothetical protein
MGLSGLASRLDWTGQDSGRARTTSRVLLECQRIPFLPCSAHWCTCTAVVTVHRALLSCLFCFERVQLCFYNYYYRVWPVEMGWYVQLIIRLCLSVACYLYRKTNLYNMSSRPTNATNL